MKIYCPRRMKLICAALLIALLGFIFGVNIIDDEVKTETVVIPAGEFFEINTRAKSAAQLQWNWQAKGGTLAFNLHTHFGGETQYVYKKTATADSGEFTVLQDGGLSFMWQNKTAGEIILMHKTHGEFVVNSYHPKREK